MKKRTKKIAIIAAITSLVVITGAIGTITLAKITGKSASANTNNNWEVVGVLQPFGVLNSYLNDTVCSADKNKNIWTYHGSDDIWKFERLGETHWDNKVRIRTSISMQNITVDPNNIRNGIGITHDDYKLYQGTSRKGGVKWAWDTNSFANWPQISDVGAVWRENAIPASDTSPLFIYGRRHSDGKIIGAADSADPELVTGIREGDIYGFGVSPDGKHAVVATGNYESNLYEYDIDTTGLVFSNERQILINEQPQLYPTYLSQNELFFSIDTPKDGLDVWLAKDVATEIESIDLK